MFGLLGFSAVFCWSFGGDFWLGNRDPPDTRLWVALGGAGWLGKGGDTARRISTTKFIRILTKKMYFLRGWNF